MKRWSFLALLVLVTLTMYSQNRLDFKEIYNSHISYTNSGDSSGTKLFKVLASETNAGIYNIGLDAKYRVIIKKDASGLKAGITKISISPNFKIGEFDISSSLWPDYAVGNITLGKEVVPVLISFSGILNNIVSNSTYGYNPQLTITEYYYSAKKFTDIKLLINEINQYHSFLKLINTFEQYQKNLSGKASLQPSVIFVNKIETLRINSINDKYNIIRFLSDYGDPENLSAHLSKYKRLETRVSTLYNKALKSNNDNPEFNNFCTLYSGITLQKIKQLETIQPDDGIAIMATAVTNASEFKILNEIAHYYQINENISTSEFYTGLFNSLATAAHQQLEKGNNSNALMFLANAKDIGNYGGIAIPEWYNKLLLDILEDITTSYLKVGYMSLKAGNKDFALNYFSRCDSLINDHLLGMHETETADTAFVGFINTESGIISYFSDNNDWDNAFKAIKREEIIAAILKLPDINDSIDKHKQRLYNDFFKWQTLQLKSALDEEQYPDAYSIFKDADESAASYRQWLNTESIIDYNILIQQLFDEYIRESEQLTKAGHPIVGLEKLIIARQIEYALSNKSDKADSLILVVAQPAILDITDQASYHVWANRLDKANELFTRAQQMSDTYFNGNNTTVNDALKSLESEILHRKCLSYQLKLNDIVSLVHISIRDNKYQRIDNLIEDADALTDSTLFCNIDTTSLHKLKSEHKYLIGYLQKINTLTSMLYNKGYAGVIESYFLVEDYYKEHVQNKYNIHFSDIESFVKEQNLLPLTAETISWYCDNNHPEEAIRFIEIYRQQGGSSRDIKTQIHDTAIQLAAIDQENNIPSAQALKEYIKDNSWYLSFRINYLKNRMF